MNIDIKKRIREENEKRGWSIYRLAKKAGLSPSTLTNMMNRGTSPSVTTLERVCEAYGMTLAELLYGKENLIHLNKMQRRHMDRWNLLTEKQQQTVELFIDGLNRMS